MSSVIGGALGLFGTTMVLGFVGTASLSALIAILPIVMGVFLGGIGLLLGSFFDLDTAAHSVLKSIDRFDKLLHTDR
jgi:uncharacterized YccA/Bax inhibitor family protein